MSRFWQGIIIGALVASAASVALWLRSKNNQQQTKANNETMQYLVINEWSVRVPTAIFSDRAAKGYLLGAVDVAKDSQALVFLDEPLSEIAADLGDVVIERAKACLPYYHGVMRSPKDIPFDDLPVSEKRLANFDYRPMVPQSTCSTDPSDTGLSEFDSHILTVPSSETIINAFVAK